MKSSRITPGGSIAGFDKIDGGDCFLHWIDCSIQYLEIRLGEGAKVPYAAFTLNKGQLWWCQLQNLNWANYAVQQHQVQSLCYSMHLRLFNDSSNVSCTYWRPKRGERVYYYYFYLNRVLVIWKCKLNDVFRFYSKKPFHLLMSQIITRILFGTNTSTPCSQPAYITRMSRVELCEWECKFDWRCSWGFVVQSVRICSPRRSGSYIIIESSCPINFNCECGLQIFLKDRF